MLACKPDWDAVKERYIAWWAHEVVDRCCIAVYAPKADAPCEEPPPFPAKLEERWLDHAFLQARNEYALRHTFFGGEAMPVWNAGYPGWAFIPVYLGAPVELAETTGWVYPIIDDGALTDHDYRKLVIDPANPWWQRAQALQHFAAQCARGNALASVGAIGGCGDTLAALRGTEQLLFDLVECPDYVREFELYLMRQWCEVYEAHYAPLRDVCEGGSSCWFDIWAPGTFYAAQNDFAYMISPRMFEEIFLPAIELQTNFLDYTVHHVDGEGNFAHVGALCQLPRLQALQILPGDGKPSPLHYMDVLKQVQAAGKNLHISIPPDEVETALRALSIEGLYISTWCASEAEARALLRRVDRWSCRTPCP